MGRIITENFRVANAKAFYNSFADTLNADAANTFSIELDAYNTNNAIGMSNTEIEYVTGLALNALETSYPTNNYYILGSAINKGEEIQNTPKDEGEFFRGTIFGNRVTQDNLRFMLKKREWVSGTIYDQYDDERNVSELDMYVTVIDGAEPESPYRVYKCLSNNYGAQSTSVPYGSGTTEFQLEDGYIWKFIFEVSAANYRLYQTTKSIPYVATTAVQSSAVENISNILIESVPFGLFTDHMLGNCSVYSYEIDENDANKKYLSLSTQHSPKTSADFYKNMYIYFSDVGGGKIYNVSNSRVDVGLSEENIVTLTIYTADDVSVLSGESCRVYPKVSVTAGSTTTSIAYATLDADGTPNGIVLFDRGEGYTYAEAELALPPTLVSNSGLVQLRAIVSPRNGHGYDPIKELSMSTIMIVTNFTNENFSEIPSSGTYTKLGLVKNISFANNIYPVTFDNRMVITCASININDPNIQVGSIVYQTINNEYVSGVIHEIDGNVLYVVEYDGPHQEQFIVAPLRIKQTEDSVTYTEVTINSITINETNGQNNNYVSGTGELLHFVDFDSIERSANTKEKVKLIFDF